jgi:dipeptidyl aminopeptidase/acylaminoacyl peptidase
MPRNLLSLRASSLALLVGILALLFIGLQASSAQYNPKRLLVYVGYARPQAHEKSLVLYDLQRRSTISLVSMPNYTFGYSPRWSPSGRYIAFFNWDEEYRSDLFLYDLQESKEIRLTEGDHNEICVNWAGSEEVLYSSTMDGRAIQAYRLNIRTGERIKIGEGLNIPCIASSPDGERYVFALYSDDENLPGRNYPETNVFISNRAFTELVQLTDTPFAKEHQPIWSPDGNYIVYSVGEYDESGEYVSSRLMVMNLEDRSTQEISSQNEGFPSYNWLSDGRLTYTNELTNSELGYQRLYQIDIVTGTRSFVDLPEYAWFYVYDWSPPTDEILPAPTPTVPAPDLRFPAAPECEGGLPSRLGMLMIAAVPDTVEGEVRTTLRVREAPDGAQVGSLNPGQRFRITDQGECDTNSVLWWPIETLDGSLSGWSAEYAGGAYLMVPIATR